MFVGWIRKASFEKDLKEFSLDTAVDENLVLNSVNENQSLCFGAYEQNKLQALITAYNFENTILINNFYYKNDFTSDLKKRLIKILLNNICDEKKTILIMANKNGESDIFKDFGFEKFADFKKAVYSSGGAVFNFSNATAKSISGENYISIIKKLDIKAFNDDRIDYITQKLAKSSSLFLSTPFGYIHSYAVGKSAVKISPYIMVDEAFADAEKLLRGVIYHRGLKKLIAFIPKEVKEITDLYASYNFQLKDDFELMYKNKKPDINLESIYGF